MKYVLCGCAIQREMQKKEMDHRLIDELMSATFSMRRNDIVGGEPLINDVKTRWPAMFSQRQVYFLHLLIIVCEWIC